MTVMTDELEQLLKNLGLRKILEIFEEELKKAEKQQPSYEDLIVRLLRAQWHAKQEAAPCVPISFETAPPGNLSTDGRRLDLDRAETISHFSS